MFSWRVYDGSGDPDRAIYTLGGHDLGRGDAGLLNFEQVVQHWPDGSDFAIRPYYSPMDQPRRLYPMNGNPIWERLTIDGRQRGIDILYPGLAFP